MLSYELIKLANIIENVSNDVNRLRDEAMGYDEEKTYEDRVVITAADVLIKAVEQTKKQISSCLPDLITGYLTELPNGRFAINGRELTCGNYLELYVQDRWITGRVEYAEQYYFYNALLNHPTLKQGMKARIIA